MTVSVAPPRLQIDITALARLMPMHALIGEDGHVLAAGPTLERVAGELAGRPFFECFEIRRPRGVSDLGALDAAAGRTLHLHLLSETPVRLRAVGVPVVHGGARHLLNLSFGIGVAEAVNQHRLTLSDFAGTDLAVEMLYILEAKAAAMTETRNLIGRLEEARSDAEARSMTDALTDLPNRRGFEQHVFRLTDLGVPFTVMAIDLDHFKAVNDQHGHTVGDAVLRIAAQRLAATLRSADIIARVGGDEFLAILKGMEDEAKLIAMGERLIAALSAPIDVEGVACRIGASVGIARTGGGDAPRAGVMIDKADSALYESKNAGRGVVTLAAV